ncbi:MAG: hypothetical protein HN350_01380 [Phycisphaerales bacterium]|jgi:hypothetical protein|nr:hypothetical protein [Phycisphaerales bacterium]
MTDTPDHKIKNILITLVLLGVVGVAIWAALSIDPMGDRGAGTGRDHDESFQKLKKFDLALVKWSENLPAIPVEMDSPVALAIFDNGNICIGGDKAIAILAPDGRKIRRIDLKFSPQALTVSGDTIFAAARDTVTVLTADGQEKAQWAPLNNKADIVSLAASQEYVYVSDAGNRVIMRYDRKTGKRTYKNGRTDSGAFMSGFNVPSPHMDVAINQEGELLTVDPGRSKVQLRDTEGDVLKSWGAAGSGITEFYGCCNPAAIAVLGDGSIVTYEKTLQRVKVYSLQGELINVVAGPNDFTDQPVGKFIVPDIAVDPTGRVLVLDTTRKTLRTFKRKIAPQPTTGASR